MAPALQAVGLGKAYRINRARTGHRYKTLQEDLIGLLRRPFGEAQDQAHETLWALRDVSFDVHPGEVVGIIGRNGAGKSTLLKVLSRITEPTTGYVDVQGRVGSLLEVGTGFHPELTGRENVYLNGAILGMARRDIERRFDEIVAFAEVERFLDTPVKRYSSGMYVRLAFAVAAHLEPEILLVDEVLAVGDAAFQRKCLGKMEGVARGGRTVLFVSHNMGIVRNLCPRSILLRDGTVHTAGPTPAVVDAYLQEVLAQQGAEATYPANPATPLYITRIAVVDADGRPNRHFRLGGDICFEIDYEVTGPLEQSMLVLAVAREGVYIFQTHDTDVQPELLLRREPGSYRARIQVPRRFLTAGLYTVTGAAAVGASGRYGHDGHPDAISFEIDEEDEDTTFKSYGRSRGMLVMAELDWGTERRVGVGVGGGR